MNIRNIFVKEIACQVDITSTEEYASYLYPNQYYPLLLILEGELPNKKATTLVHFNSKHDKAGGIFPVPLFGNSNFIFSAINKKLNAKKCNKNFIEYANELLN